MVTKTGGRRSGPFLRDKTNVSRPGQWGDGWTGKGPAHCSHCQRRLCGTVYGAGGTDHRNIQCHRLAGGKLDAGGTFRNFRINGWYAQTPLCRLIAGRSKVWVFGKVGKLPVPVSILNLFLLPGGHAIASHDLRRYQAKQSHRQQYGTGHCIGKGRQTIAGNGQAIASHPKLFCE